MLSVQDDLYRKFKIKYATTLEGLSLSRLSLTTLSPSLTTHSLPSHGPLIALSPLRVPPPRAAPPRYARVLSKEYRQEIDDNLTAERVMLLDAIVARLAALQP